MAIERPHSLDYEDLGIPSGFSFRGLLIDPVDGFLVARFAQRAKPYFDAFWVRGFSEENYRPLCGVVPNGHRYTSCAVDAGGGKLYVNVLHQRPFHGEAEAEAATGWDWFGIECYDLATGAKLSLLSSCAVDQAEGEVWISDILAQSHVPGHVMATVGMLHPVKGGNYATYHICSLEMASGDATILTELRATFI